MNVQNITTMQKDFHYGIIKILSLKAGFDQEQSELIAYASQYVDDATIHRPIRLNQAPALDTPRVKGKTFDPVCTAHKGLQFIEDFKRRVQEQIYLCFHFLPEKPYAQNGDYDYIVKPNGELAQMLIYWALSKLKNQTSTENFIRLGVALHTYADTWAHQNFTGTHSHLHNDLEHIEIWTGQHWKRIKPYRQFINNIFPDIGHAEAYDFPDLPYLRWRYIKDKTKEIILRDNPGIYLDAAQKIYELLCNFTNEPCSWEETSKWLLEFFSYQNSKSYARLKYLNMLFPEVKLEYDEHQWLKQALAYKKMFRYFIPSATTKDDIKWFIFHKVAYEQRVFILKRIKRLTNRFV